MKLSNIKEILCAEALCKEVLLEREVTHAFGSDLMSDVLAYVKGQTVLLTGLINAQVIRTAEMAELSGIVFVRGKMPDADTINLALENDIAILVTKDTMYTASGKLYSCGLRGIDLEQIK